MATAEWERWLREFAKPQAGPVGAGYMQQRDTAWQAQRNLDEDRAWLVQYAISKLQCTYSLDHDAASHAVIAVIRLGGRGEAIDVLLDMMRAQYRDAQAKTEDVGQG